MRLEQWQGGQRTPSYSNPQPVRCWMLNAAADLPSDDQCHPYATHADKYCKTCAVHPQIERTQVEGITSPGKTSLFTRRFVLVKPNDRALPFTPPCEKSSLLCACIQPQTVQLQGIYHKGSTVSGHGTCSEVACP